MSAALPEANGLLRARVLRVHHWTDTLFSFHTERDPGFRFASGQFTMVGLPVEGRPLLRAYSMVSAHYDDQLEFLSIKVPGGRLTSHLQHLRDGDEVYLGRKPSGSLAVHQLLPGRRLFLLSTGTGIAPFLSLLKDPELYERFDRIVLTHSCRRAAELVYGDVISCELPLHPLLGEAVRRKLLYYPHVTREAFRHRGRITELIESGRLFSDLALPPLEPEHDRLMLCGNWEMIRDTRALLSERGFRPGEPGEPGHFVWEKAFAAG